MASTSRNSFDARANLSVGGRAYEIYRLDALSRSERLPYSLKVLLENMLRHEDALTVNPDDIEALAGWDATAEPSREIAFAPARILMQDFTGVPAVVDLAAMRDAMVGLGGNPAKVNPLIPAEPSSNSGATKSATGSFVGARTPSRLFAWYPRTPGSATRSTLNTWRASCSRPKMGPLTPTRCSARTLTQR
jgi:hypothetical protein